MIENNFFIWDENKNILQTKKNYKQEEIDKCGITTETNEKLKKEIFNTTTQKNSGIYKIIHKDSGKYYVGRSSNLKKRLKEHLYMLTNNNHHNDFLQNAWNKYGNDAFEFIISEYVENNMSLLKEYEQKYLDIIKNDRLNGINNSYNCDENSEFGGPMSEQSRLKISTANRNRIWKDESRKKLSILNKGKNNKMYGTIGPNRDKKLSNETRLKISKSKIGTKLSDETKEKLSKINYGKKLSTETIHKLKEKLSGKNNPMYGKKHNEETRKKMSELAKMRNSKKLNNL
jgi:group I intron endonuclease